MHPTSLLLDVSASLRRRPLRRVLPGTQGCRKNQLISAQLFGSESCERCQCQFMLLINPSQSWDGFHIDMSAINESECLSTSSTVAGFRPSLATNVASKWSGLDRAAAAHRVDLDVAPRLPILFLHIKVKSMKCQVRDSSASWVP